MILVAYASKNGSTREVAEAIAGVLHANGHAVHFRSAAEVSDLKFYSGVVLGGSIYVGRWHPERSTSSSGTPTGSPSFP
jgi:menaquinone-dependent protoporphyrinogen oxidase